MSKSAGKRNGIFAFYFKTNLLYRILIALVLGAVCGMIFAGHDDILNFISPFGDLFVRLLKMIMVPIIICSLIIGTSSISPSRLGRVGVKSILFYTFTSFLAVCIGIACAMVFKPGSGLTLDAAQAVAKTAKTPSMTEILLNIVPTNPFSSISSGEILPIICFCIFFGISLSFCKESAEERIQNAAEVVYSFFDGMCEIMYKIVRWVMEYAPIGVFALLFTVFNKNGSSAFGSLANVTFTLYIGLAIQIFLVYCVICLFIKLSPLMFLKKVRPPMITAFVTRSSNGTLPVSMKTAEEDMGVPRGVYGFVLPVGATINMNGTVIYQGVCALFIANACGIDLSMNQYVTIVITSVLAAIGTAGVPGAGALMLLLVLESIGLNVVPGSNIAVAYGMILGIDAILDMGRTSMNVVGDMIASVWVAKTEGELDMSKWSNASRDV